MNGERLPLVSSEYPYCVYHLAQNGEDIGFYTRNFPQAMERFNKLSDGGETGLAIWKDEWYSDTNFDEYVIVAQREHGF